MKRMIVFKSWLYVIMVLLCTACVPASPEEENTEELVQVNPIAGGYYASMLPSVRTRATAQDSETLQDRPIFLLEDGSTIRLVVYDDAKNLLEEYSKAYLVRNAGTSGSSLLYPCEVDDNGAVISSSSTPLYMKAGTYYFRILSPAKALNSKGFVNIGNGEYLLATDDRYTQTAMTAVTITKIDEGGTLNNVQTLYLPPIINQTARMQFTVRAGEGVHTLEMLAEGIEISGIQQPLDNTTSFDWVNGDVLPVKVGDQSASVRITQATRNADNSLVAHTGVLPTDARSHSISVLLNLKVNGNPTQYQMLLTGLYLTAGHSYNYTATVKISNGVTVLTWQNRSWTENVVMDE